MVWKPGRGGKKSKQGRGKPPRFTREMLRRRKKRQFQIRRGLPSSLQAQIDDRDIGVAVSLFSLGVRRRQVKTATW